MNFFFSLYKYNRCKLTDFKYLIVRLMRSGENFIFNLSLKQKANKAKFQQKGIACDNQSELSVDPRIEKTECHWRLFKALITNFKCESQTLFFFFILIYRLQETHGFSLLMSQYDA